MNTERHNMQDGNQPSTGESQSHAGQDKKDISLPKIDRPEGPFEHSGEVARWTNEEREEKEDQQNQEQAGKQGQQ